MIHWFRRLLVWQQVAVIVVTVIVGSTAVTTLADPSSQPPQETSSTSTVATLDDGGREAPGFAGTYVGSFVVLEVIRPSNEPWEPFAVMNLYVDADGTAHAEGSCQESTTASWGTAVIDYVFQCDGAIGADSRIECEGTSRLRWTWDLVSRANAPQTISLWRPAAYMEHPEESFDAVPVTLTIDLVPHQDQATTLIGTASPSWDMTSDSPIGVIGGGWFGPPGTPGPWQVDT